MSKDPYSRSNGFIADPYYAKKTMEGELIVVLTGSLSDRGLELIKPISRGVKQGEVHELILTDELTAAPGQTVNSIAYLGFMEVKSAAVLVEGDELKINGETIGFLAGFDQTHMPNHLNIVFKAAEKKCGRTQQLELGSFITLSKHKK